MKRLFFIFYILASLQLQAQQVPLIISSHIKIIENLTKETARTLPSGLEILLYPIMGTNLTASEDRLITNLFTKELTTKFKDINNSVSTINMLSDPSIKEALTTYPSNEEILNIASYLKKEIVLFINISKIKNDFRSIWSPTTRAIEKKPIYLLQATMMKSDSHYVLMRFFNYFYLE